MNALERRLVAMAVLLSGAALALSAPTVIAAAAILIPLVAVLLGPRLEADRLVQAIANVAAMVGGVLVTRATTVNEDLETALTERALLFGMPMLGVASVRAMIQRPVYGDRVTLAAGLVALTAAGRAKVGIPYGVLAAGFVVMAIAALRAADAHRAAIRYMSPRHYMATTGGIVVALGLAVFARWSLPRVHDAMLARLMARFATARTGFSDNMTLGSMSGMLQSDTVVLRVRGDVPPLLRGVVLNRYSRGQWESGVGALSPEVVETPTHSTGESGAVEIEHARAPKRYFLPLGAENVVVSSGFYARDDYGIARPTGEVFAKRIWFTQGAEPTSPEPRIEDLELPHRVAQPLGELLLTWGVVDQPPREKLQIIERHLLDDYTYSLEVDRDPRKDPVVDFLFIHKQGHCEYFASAFTLLARAARIPARVAAGYRAVERSPFGYTIVREKHAHSWSEAWVDGRWQTFDPTPAGDLASSADPQTAWLSAFFDGLRTTWEVVDDWLARRTAFEFTLSLVGAVGVLILIRALRQRGQRAARRPMDPRPIEIDRLVAALARHGIERSASETLERFAVRVDGSDRLDVEVRAEVRRALELYEGLRYGQSGEPRVVLDQVARAAQRVG
ncbi:MAG: DUF3488 and transglutaminase-like domain-containing protein [Polyangiaceae bacterium]